MRFYFHAQRITTVPTIAERAAQTARAYFTLPAIFRAVAMVYLNLHLPTLRTEAFLHSSREQIGTWLLLVSYCAEQENHGTIANCRNWSATTWTRVTGSDTPSDDCMLWTWANDSLQITHYPIKHEFIAQHKRAIARNAGIARSKKRVS